MRQGHLAPVVLLAAMLAAGCRMARNDWDMSGVDTVPAAQFAPQADTIPQIDLGWLTGVAWPSYHVVGAEPLAVADSVATLDGESLLSGNYELTLALDSVPGDSLLAQIGRRAEQDSLWTVGADAITYSRRTRHASYRLTFQRGTGRVTVTRRNR